MPIGTIVGPGQCRVITRHSSTITTACQGKRLPSHFGTSQLPILSFLEALANGHMSPVAPSPPVADRRVDGTDIAQRVPPGASLIVISQNDTDVVLAPVGIGSCD
jgi:hypothetical protein